VYEVSCDVVLVLSSGECANEERKSKNATSGVCAYTECDLQNKSKLAIS
jgi:hypothetical protein